MRLGLISDIHGNCIALDAVLGELERERVDGIVCLGDVAVGPQPRQALARVRELGCPVVLGNWDATFVGADVLPVPVDEDAVRVNEAHAWWSEQLGDEDRAFLRTFAPRLELDVGGARALCFHGSPRSYDDCIFATTPDSELEAMFAERPPLLLGGHTHVQLLRRWGRSLLVNPGSVGLPFLAWRPEQVRIAPWAEYAVVTADAGRVRVDLRRTPFDVEALLRISRASGMPHADWWASGWDLAAAA